MSIETKYASIAQKLINYLRCLGFQDKNKLLVYAIFIQESMLQYDKRQDYNYDAFACPPI